MSELWGSRRQLAMPMRPRARRRRVISGHDVRARPDQRVRKHRAHPSGACDHDHTELLTFHQDRKLPIVDISVPQAAPDGVRRRMNGDFLGIDDLYRQSRPLPGAYIEDSGRLVAVRAAEFAAWLERTR